MWLYDLAACPVAVTASCSGACHTQCRTGACYWHLPNALAEVTMKSETLTILNTAR